MKFYYIRKEYLEYLRQIDNRIMLEKEAYDSNFKFALGVVLIINDIEYFVPVSSIKRHQLDINGNLKKPLRQTSIPIIIDDNSNDKIVALLRFAYMFPVPQLEKEPIVFSDIEDVQRRIFMQKEYKYIKKLENTIKTKASDVYKKATNPVHFLSSLCCNFKLLELKYQEWLVSSKKSN